MNEHFLHVLLLSGLVAIDWRNNLAVGTDIAILSIVHGLVILLNNTIQEYYFWFHWDNLKIQFDSFRFTDKIYKLEFII